MTDVVRGWTRLWAELAGKQLDEGGYGGALGGVFLGDSSIDGSDLRDMNIYMTGPSKEKMLARAENMVKWYRDRIRPVLA